MDAFTIARIVCLIGLALVVAGVVMGWMRKPGAIGVGLSGLILACGAATADMLGWTA